MRQLKRFVPEETRLEFKTTKDKFELLAFLYLYLPALKS